MLSGLDSCSQAPSPTSVCGPGPAPAAGDASCMAALSWREATALCCMWLCVSRQASLQGVFPSRRKHRSHEPWLPVLITGEGGTTHLPAFRWPGGAASAAGLSGARPPCSTAWVAWAEILPLRNICMDIAVKPCACFIILALQCSS